MAVRVHLDPVALQAFARSPQGPILRHSLAVCEQVVSGAKGRVGVSEGFAVPFGSSATAGPHLRDAIVKRVQLVGPLFKVWIEANRPYAEHHHRGTDPHPIAGNPLLRFFWPKIGEIVVVRSVFHKGTKANPYLTGAARDVGLKVVDR